MIRTLLLTVAAGGIALAIDLAIGTAAPRFTHVPREFPPFTFLPVFSGTVGGAVLASIAYSIIRITSRNPDQIFFFVSLAVFALSLGLPLRLSFTHSSRFAGVTPSAQMVLVLMHAIVMVVSFVTLTARPQS
jgi:hypothetical protein